MRYYESLYIVNPNYEQERLDDVIKLVADKAIEYGFSIINHRIWGKKRLAYPIEKHKYGSFILLHFETESTGNLGEFERFMILQKAILRNQTVSLANKPEAHVEDVPVQKEEEKETVDDSPAVIDTKEKSKVESEKNSEEGPSIEEETVVETEEGSAQNKEEEKVEPAIEEETKETKEKSNVESEKNSEEGPSIEEETMVETEEGSAQNKEEEKVEPAIEEETTEEVQE